MFLRQTMSRRMQLVNLSLISVEGREAKKKTVEHGLTSLILTAAQLDFNILYQISQFKDKADIIAQCFTVFGLFHHLPLFDI